MGPDNGDSLKQSLISKNNKNWHSFQEISFDDDITDISGGPHSRQNSLDRNRNSKFFPWATANGGTSIVRRRSSVSQPRFSSVSPDAIASFATFEQGQEGRGDQSDSSEDSESSV